MIYKNNLLLLIYLIAIIIQFVHAYRNFHIDGVQTILTLENELIHIHCRKDVAIEYCGFVHPSGKRFSFSGLDLHDGDCTVDINVTQTDTGEWVCHVGNKVGPEMVEKIKIRIANDVAAVRPHVIAKHKKMVTLECVTTKEMRPLSYCRFEPPTGSPFSIDSTVQFSNPILGKYYYPQNRSLDRGDCSVTIKNVDEEDMGEWTCGAGLDDGKEHIDVIKLEVHGSNGLSLASVTSIVVFVVTVFVLCLLLLCQLAIRIRQFLGYNRRRRPEVVSLQEMGPPRLIEGSGRTINLPSIVIQSPSAPNSPTVPC